MLVSLSLHTLYMYRRSRRFCPLLQLNTFTRVGALPGVAPQQEGNWQQHYDGQRAPGIHSGDV